VISEKYRTSEAEADTDEYIRLGYKLANAFTEEEDCLERASRLSILGEALWERNRIIQAAADLDDSIRIAQEVVDASNQEKDYVE
jgi:hypothetical protein